MDMGGDIGLPKGEFPKNRINKFNGKFAFIPYLN